MPHALTSYTGTRNLDAAPVADYAFMLDSLIFTAIAFIILGRTEYPFAEKAVLFRLEGPVVDGLRFLDLPLGP